MKYAVQLRGSLAAPFLVPTLIGLVCAERPCILLVSIVVLSSPHFAANRHVFHSPIPPRYVRMEHHRLGTTVVVAGYSSGGVSFFHTGNGTELGSADTGSGAVLAVKRGGQVSTKRGAGLLFCQFNGG